MKKEINWEDINIAEFINLMGEQDWLEFKSDEILDTSNNWDKKRRQLLRKFLQLLILVVAI